MKYDNIKVSIRLRKPLRQEADLPILVRTDSSTTVVIESPSREKVAEKRFYFDQCFGPEVEQLTIYNNLIREYILHTLEGFNTCIFAYGQTSSGKSFTMMGTKNNLGLIPRICEELFETIDICLNITGDDEVAQMEFTVHCSYLEIYNEQVRDLLSPENNSKLKIREAQNKSTFIENLSEFKVRNASEILEYLRKGNLLRSTGRTNANYESSRSHAIFTIMISQHETTPIGDIVLRRSSMKLVDLAGSERVSASGATGERLREGSNINKSLTTLGRVISALSKKNRPGSIPYRDSTLTWVLKENLGGNSKTCMIACISPCDREETLSTLRYATTAKDVKQSARTNTTEVSKGKQELNILNEQLRELQQTLSDQSERLHNQNLLEAQLNKIHNTNIFLEKRIQDENERAFKYYKKWRESEVECENLSKALLHILGVMMSTSQLDLQPQIDLLKLDCEIFEKNLKSDILECQTLLKKYSL